jgi:hypothetical protein
MHVLLGSRNHTLQTRRRKPGCPHTRPLHTWYWRQVMSLCQATPQLAHSSWEQ